MREKIGFCVELGLVEFGVVVLEKEIEIFGESDLIKSLKWVFRTLVGIEGLFEECSILFSFS